MGVYLLRQKSISDLLKAGGLLEKLLNEGKVLGMGEELFYVSEEKLIPQSKKVNIDYLGRQKEKHGVSLTCESLELWARLGTLEDQYRELIKFLD